MEKSYAGAVQDGVPAMGGPFGHSGSGKLLLRPSVMIFFLTITTTNKQQQTNKNTKTKQGAKEGCSWVYKGASVHNPSNRALISLSTAGSDACIVREFDLTTKQFLTGEGFFNLTKEAKSHIYHVDADSVLVGTDFGEGSLTESGYPRIVKLWKRGEPLSEAKTIFEGDVKDVSAYGYVSRSPPNGDHVVVGAHKTFYTSHEFLLRDGQLVRVPKPDDAKLDTWGKYVLLELRSDWHTWKAGSLLIGDLDEFLKHSGEGTPNLTPLFVPSDVTSLDHYITTRNRVVACVLDNVVSRLQEYALVDGAWVLRSVKAPSPGSFILGSMADEYLAEDPLAEAYHLTYKDFLTPSTLFQCMAGSDERQILKSMPSFFDSTGMKAEQYFTTSKDGTKVPYFIVFPANFKLGANTPTILYGYGGFEVSETPHYSGIIGRCWLSRGGCYVLANIRGGGEYGPKWHQAALKEKRQNAYDDFIAVAEDLIQRQVTTARHLGIKGGSNGGLLVAAVMLQRPDLFHSVVCQCPLIDMKRFNKLLAGASWMGEYGDPDTEDFEKFISKYSPYHNVPAKGAKKLPRIFFTTSTKDDRVHPGHARKMVARLLEEEHDVLLYENIEGGHSNAADNSQRAAIYAYEYSFEWKQLDNK